MSELLYSQEQMLKVRNENYAAGQADERKRIIKLLESRLQHQKLAEIDRSAAVMNYQIRAMVELIKGENK